MSKAAVWPVAAPVQTARLRLEPLSGDHAAEAFPLFDDRRLHVWTGGEPPSPEQLADRFRRQAVGRSPDGSQGWLNWMLRRTADGNLVGIVQATVTRPQDGGLDAELAWVIGVPWQGLGYGYEGAQAMAGWLRNHGVTHLAAHIHPAHDASSRIARALGLTATGTVSDEGEILWRDHA